ncbi:hypothetical protein [Nocardioides sp. WS12]|uniref:hypothetical protein n=1 Tax=Nocardioides sp. WS12 TaxID=2486272 RepID=UPI0015FE5DB0|nr:hypothetical protein [Nocardioides sp. WS12]
MFRFSWALALACSLVMLTGILIVTRDLAITNDIFKDGVVQAEKVNDTTDDALSAAEELPGADDALIDSMPEVTGVMGSLSNAEVTLATLADRLATLGITLQSADGPLVGIIEAGKTATHRANRAAIPVRTITGTLAGTRKTISSIGSELDRTIRLARTIESKLHLLLLLPTLPSGK